MTWIPNLGGLFSGVYHLEDFGHQRQRHPHHLCRLFRWTASALSGAAVCGSFLHFAFFKSTVSEGAVIVWPFLLAEYDSIICTPSFQPMLEVTLNPFFSIRSLIFMIDNILY